MAATPGSAGDSTWTFKALHLTFTMSAFAFTAGSLGDILATAGLVAQVVKALYDNKNLAKECEILAIELQSLQSVLLMVEFALRQYDSTPLWAPLAHFVRPEVAQCHLALKAFSDNIFACQKALSLTTVGSLWRQVVWAASDEAASLSGKISGHRLKLCTLLITLNSRVPISSSLNSLLIPILQSGVDGFWKLSSWPTSVPTERSSLYSGYPR